MSLKKALSLLLVLVLLLGCLPLQVLAEDEEAVIVDLGENMKLEELGISTNEELFSGYAQQVFYGTQMTPYGITAGARLTGNTKIIYDALIPFVREIANGQRKDTSIGLGKTATVNGVKYTADVDVAFENTTIYFETVEKAILALYADMPFEMYWCMGYGAFSISGGGKIKQLVVELYLADGYYDYADSERLTANRTATGRAASAAANAMKIVEKYAAASDYDKLVGYANEICALVTYDNKAASGGYADEFYDPWTLIYVFDGNKSTNVVCEGYSEAYKYLCDQSVFLRDISCNLATGSLNAGPHEWNIVTIYNKNYMVDITNSDAGATCNLKYFLLHGEKGSVLQGYRFHGNLFTYDSECRGNWGTGDDSILKLDTEPFDMTVFEVTPMHRLYNPNSGEHFYTGSPQERDTLVSFGWQYEGIAWNAPIQGGQPVYRLFNPNNGDHHYTMSAQERDMLVGYGWQYEGVCWNSAGTDKLPLYRLFNPNADCGSHHYTGSVEERDFLVSVGWIYEGIGWYGIP